MLPSGLGSNRFKNYLPIMVMTTRLQLDQLHPRASSSSSSPAESVFMVWLTGICPTQNPIYVTLTVWQRPHKNKPSMHRVQSGHLYSIRMPQKAIDVFRSGHGIVLTTQQCNSVTSGGKKLIKMQVTVN